MISTFYNLRLAVISFTSQIATEIVSQQSHFQYFHNKIHLSTVHCLTEGTNKDYKTHDNAL